MGFIVPYKKFFAAKSPPGPSRIRLDQVAGKTSQAMNGLKGLSESFVVRNIARYNRIVKTVRALAGPGLFGLVAGTRKFEVVFRGVGVLRRFFVRIDKQSQGVKKQARAFLSVVDAQRRVLDQALDVERRYLDALLDENRGRTGGQKDPLADKVRAEALDIRARLCAERIKMLERFSVEFDRVRPAMFALMEEMDRFMFVASHSAAVYDEALRTLVMKRDLDMALATADRFASLDALAQSVTNQWESLNEVQKRLIEHSKNWENE
jgi:hypothetical protein